MRSIEQRRAACNKSAKKKREMNPDWWKKKDELKKKFDLLGNLFGSWTVVEKAPIKNNVSYWVCVCECGTKKTLTACSLRQGLTKSCGCKKSELISASLSTHGDTGSKEYTAWTNMKGRCYNKNNENYPNYGAHGIIVCDRWLNSYGNFIEDMGICPSPELSLDRINVNGNYEPSNCRWATSFVQANNKRNNVSITYDGYTMNISQWARVFSINQARFYKKRFKDWEKENIVDFFFKKGVVNYSLIDNYNKMS